MLETLFLRLLNISITAGWFVLAVMVFRVLFRKSPKAFHVCLWALVGIRLLLPFSIESIFSIVPSAETIPEDIIYATAPTIHSGIEVLNSTVNPILSTSMAPEVGASVNPIQILIILASNLWVLGMILMGLYVIMSYLRLQRRVRESIWTKEGIWLCDQIDSPFVLGVLRPRIYVPSFLEEKELEYVIAHEKAHIQRRDHLWKPLGFLLLTVYWFNPILWAAYILLCRDIEFACDEKVIGSLGAESKKPYSMALINCSVSRKSIAACPLAFGEVGVKSRIESVLNYKKPAFWVVILTTITTCILAVLFLTNPIATNINVITEEKGYEIIDQKEYDLVLEIPRDVLVEEVYSYNGKEFAQDEVVVYEIETSTIYVKYILQSGAEKTRLDFIFDISYHDLDKYNKVIVPYEITDWGYTHTIWSNEEAAVTRGMGPGESFTFTINTDLAKQSDDTLMIHLTANELTYEKKFIFNKKPSMEIENVVKETLEGYIYHATEVVYGHRLIDSFVYFDHTMPSFAIADENLHLYTTDFPEEDVIGGYYDVGEIQSFELTKENFDAIIDEEFDPWMSGYSAKEIRDGNYRAYRVKEEETERARFYYVLEQVDGDVYIAYGYEDIGIRYIFKVYQSSEFIDLGYHTYICEKSGKGDVSTLRLYYSTKQFTFSESSISSYLGYGSYTTENGKLILKTDDGLYTYTFDIGDNLLIYQGKYIYRKVKGEW